MKMKIEGLRTININMLFDNLKNCDEYCVRRKENTNSQYLIASASPCGVDTFNLIATSDIHKMLRRVVSRINKLFSKATNKMKGARASTKYADSTEKI
jgi:hypothetical protein